MMRTRNKIIDFSKVESGRRSTNKRSGPKEKENAETKKFQEPKVSLKPRVEPPVIRNEKEVTSLRKPQSSKYAISKTKADFAKTTFSITVCDNNSEIEFEGTKDRVLSSFNLADVKIKVEKLIDDPTHSLQSEFSEVNHDKSDKVQSNDDLSDSNAIPDKNSKGILTDRNQKHEADINLNKFEICYCPVLKEIYEELDSINQGPSLLLKDDSKTVEHVWNDLIDSNYVNDTMRKQESFLSGVSLLRIGVENAWLRKREQRSEALSRRALGRLRPNPKRSNYADMVPSGRSRKFKKHEEDNTFKTVHRRPGRPRQKDSVMSNHQHRKDSLLRRHSASSKAFNNSRKRAVNIARRARQQRNKPSSRAASLSDSDSFSNRTETRSSTLKLRPQRYLAGLRSGDVSSYISKRFCYGNDKGQGKVNSDYLHQKRKRKCVDLKPQKEKVYKKTKSDTSSEMNRNILKKKPSTSSASTSVNSTPIKESVKHQNPQPIPKPKFIQSPKNMKICAQDNVNKIMEERELRKLQKMQQRIEKESLRRDKQFHGKISDWPPKDRALSILDRLILGLDCDLIRGNDPKGVELRGLSKPDFDKLRERIRKSGYFFGYIQYYPEEENPNGRDEYDCCITSDENRRNMRGSSRSNNSESANSMVADPKRQLMRKIQQIAHTPASTAAIKLSKKARHSYPLTVGAAKRKHVSGDDDDDDDNSRERRENLSDIEAGLNEPPHKQRPPYNSGSDSDTGSADDVLSGSPVVKKLVARQTSLIEEEIPLHRRHSPKKVIRKVYTGNSSQPKILSKKRQQPLSGSTVINASTSLLTTTRIPEPPIHSVTASSKIFSTPSSSYRSSQASTVTMRPSSAVTSSSQSNMSQQKSLIRHESQEFWRLKGVEQNQIMDKHILTPATAMTASEIMRLKRFEAETCRPPNDFTLPIGQGSGRTFNKVFHTSNTVSSASVTDSSCLPPKLEIDGEETDDDFEFQIQLPPTTNIVKNAQSLKLIAANDSAHHNTSELPRLPLASEFCANNSNDDTASEDSPHKNSKRRIIHQFHTFRKILPKSASLSASNSGPNNTTANIAQPQVTQKPQFPLISSPQGRPMVPPVTAYANNVLNKSLNSKSESNVMSAPSSTGKSNDHKIQDADESSSKSENSSDLNKGHTQLLKSLLESGRAPSPSVTQQQSASNTSGLSLQQIAPNPKSKPGYYSSAMQQGRGSWQVNKPRVSVLPGSTAGCLPNIVPSNKPKMVGLPADNKVPNSGVKVRVSTPSPVSGQPQSVLKIAKCDSFSHRALPVMSKVDNSNPKLVPNNQPTR